MKSIGLLGLTGQGIETAGEILSNVLTKLGYTHRTWRDFSTIIRGGYTSFEIYVCEKEETTPPPRIHSMDLAVVWDDEGVERYQSRMKDVNMIYGSNKTSCIGENRRADVPKIGYNVWSLGIISGFLGIPVDLIEDEVKSRFKGTLNLELVQKGYETGLEIATTTNIPSTERDHITLSGNDALSIGAISGDVRHYFGYPITPASEIMENLIKWLPDLGGSVIQVEDEIAAIHAALGSSFAGKRTFVATSGPGLSLMTEGLSYAAATEIPIVIVDNQRGGPSTGMPTKTEQSDLLHLRHAGHGEFARILLTPTNVIDCVITIQEALNLADYYQCPVLVALDLDLALRRVSLPWSEVESALESIQVDRGPTIIDTSVVMDNYKRFESGPDGSPPVRTIPGIKGGAYVASGDEHDERGWMEPDYTVVRNTLHKRRFSKADQITYRRPFTQIGKSDAPIALIGTGSFGELIEYLVKTKPETYQAILIRQLAPAPITELKEALKHANRVIVAEYNARGQIRSLLKDAFTEIDTYSVQRFDGEHFTDKEFELAIELSLNEKIGNEV